MTPYESYQLLQQSVNKYVELTITDGRNYKGNVVNVDQEKVTLNVQYNAQSQNERFFPFISIPLAFIAGAAIGHHPYPYPYQTPPYSPYAYPYNSYNPYSPYTQFNPYNPYNR